MGRLFILGNGYDSAKGLKTGYKYFKEWIENEYVKENKRFASMIESNDLSSLNNINTYGSCIYDIIIVQNCEEQSQLNEIKKTDEDERMAMAAYLLLKLFKEDDALWDDFETSLGSIDCKSLISEWERENNARGQFPAAPLGSPVPKVTALITSISNEIKKLFEMWIKSLGKYVKRPDVVSYKFEDETIGRLSDNDVVVIFNYTNTLETILDETDNNNIYHIHGSVDKGQSLIVGHNNEMRMRFNPLSSSKDYIDDFIDSLRKDSQMVINNNEELWAKLRKIATQNERFIVYEYGWKGIGVDARYMKKFAEIICESKDYYIYVNDYKGVGKEKKEKWSSYGIDNNRIEECLYDC